MKYLYKLLALISVISCLSLVSCSLSNDDGSNTGGGSGTNSEAGTDDGSGTGGGSGTDDGSGTGGDSGTDDGSSTGGGSGTDGDSDAKEYETQEELLEAIETLSIGEESNNTQIIGEVSVQSQYSKEEEGAPARPTWIDSFRYYPEADFLKKGRYVLNWRKDPGTNGILGNQWEVYQISFKDYDAIESLSDPIDLENVESIAKIMASSEVTTNLDTPEPEKINNYTEDKDVAFAQDVLPANADSTISSDSWPGIPLSINNNTQVGYFPVNGDRRKKIVGYKIRIYTTKNDYDDDGNPITKEIYNDSTVLMVQYREGLFAFTGVASGGGGTGGGSGSSTVIPDTITDLDGLRTELGYSSDQYFSDAWENRRITTKADIPLSQLMTKDDFEHLFPHRNDSGTTFHSAEQPDYYTYENFLRAASYFPKFLGEGTDEDKYRELSAFLAHKSHEVGDGWPAANNDGSEAGRWSYGLVWIEELAFRGTTTPVYFQDHPDYPPTPGKSYHGRGPVQLSWNYNYGAMSETLFDDKNILLDNPNLVMSDGVIGFASAIWFWMQPQAPKPSAHDVIVGNLNLDQDDVAITGKSTAVSRSIESNSTGHYADGSSVDYAAGSAFRVPNNAEVGFGLTINIINGGLEAGVNPLDGRQTRRIGYFARYLDYFGKTKLSLSNPLSPQVGGIGGDDVPIDTIEHMKTWRDWANTPEDVIGASGDLIPSIIGAGAQSPW